MVIAANTSPEPNVFSKGVLFRGNDVACTRVCGTPSAALSIMEQLIKKRSLQCCLVEFFSRLGKTQEPFTEQSCVARDFMSTGSQESAFSYIGRVSLPARRRRSSQDSWQRENIAVHA